jgi:hypothetical protein
MVRGVIIWRRLWREEAGLLDKLPRVFSPYGDYESGGKEFESLRGANAAADAADRGETSP